MSAEFFQDAPPNVEEWFDRIVSTIAIELGESFEAWRGAAVMLHATAQIFDMLHDTPDAALAAVAGLMTKLVELPTWPESRLL